MAIDKIPSAALDSGVPTRAQLPAGSVLQVVTANKFDTFSVSSQTWTDITGLSASITPISISSRILVVGSVAVGPSSEFAYIRLLRDSTVIDVGDAAGSRVQVTGAFGAYTTAPSVAYNMSQIPVSFVDSPATTSPVTYKFQLRSGAGTQIVYINRTSSDRDTANYEWRTPSNIVLMEIAG